MKNKIFNVFGIIVILVALFTCGKYFEHISTSVSIPPNTGSRIEIHYSKFKKLKFKHGYEEIHPSPVVRNLSANSFDLAFRWKCMTDAVEDRYNLPRNFIFAMMVQESSGTEFLLNRGGDGGAGLSHMQPTTAREFGLISYENCTGHICNGIHKTSCVRNGRKMNHARDLSNFIQENKSDRFLLSVADDRLHHLKNLDAVGRMLAFDMDQPQNKGRKGCKRLGPLRTALCRYTGYVNYEGYWRNVVYTMIQLEDSSFVDRLKRNFNRKNPNLRINNEPADWDTYVQSYCNLAENYGLSEYKALQKYVPVNSEIVKKTYKNFLIPTVRPLK